MKPKHRAEEQNIKISKKENQNRGMYTYLMPENFKQPQGQLVPVSLYLPALLCIFLLCYKNLTSAVLLTTTTSARRVKCHTHHSPSIGWENVIIHTFHTHTVKLTVKLAVTTPAHWFGFTLVLKCPYKHYISSTLEPYSHGRQKPRLCKYSDVDHNLHHYM